MLAPSNHHSKIQAKGKAPRAHVKRGRKTFLKRARNMRNGSPALGAQIILLTTIRWRRQLQLRAGCGVGRDEIYNGSFEHLLN